MNVVTIVNKLNIITTILTIQGEMLSFSPIPAQTPVIILFVLTNVVDDIYYLFYLKTKNKEIKSEWLK